MKRCYVELRKSSARGTDSIAADMMRHLHSRQHLGKVLIICQQPGVGLPIARKQWMKLSRVLQKQRASTLNADKILKYTHAIITMQNMRFSTKPPLEQPEADIYFADPAEPITLPANCYTIYNHEPLAKVALEALTSQLPEDALIVDYDQAADWASYGLQPKTVLEQHVDEQWHITRHYLHERDINVTSLHPEHMEHVEAMDDALDTLLISPHNFLKVATEFQRALELARPLRITKQLRLHFDSLMLLAHRVQTLTTTAFSQHFLENYNEDDTFFLYDNSRRRFTATGETLAEAIARHEAAGHPHIAKALRTAV